jgi:hypothetical protein
LLLKIHADCTVYKLKCTARGEKLHKEKEVAIHRKHTGSKIKKNREGNNHSQPPASAISRNAPPPPSLNSRPSSSPPMRKLNLSLLVYPHIEEFVVRSTGGKTPSARDNMHNFSVITIRYVIISLLFFSRI